MTKVELTVQVSRKQITQAILLLRSYPFMDKFNDYAKSKNIQKAMPLEEETQEIGFESAFKNALKNKETNAIIEDINGSCQYDDNGRIQMMKDKSAIHKQMVAFTPYLFPVNSESEAFAIKAIEHNVEFLLRPDSFINITPSDDTEEPKKGKK